MEKDKVTGWHCTTPRKLERYKATGVILPPVRFWKFKSSAKDWAKKTKRTIILEIDPKESYPLPDHRPRGHAMWTPDHIRQWRIV